MGHSAHPERLLQQGIRALNKGDCEGAIDKFLEARRLDAENPELEYYLGIAWARRGDYARAVDALNRVMESDAEYLHKLHTGMVLGYIHTLREEYEKALPYFRRVVDDGLENAQAYAAIGYIMDRLGDFKQAVMNLYRAVEIDPDNANAHNSLGYIFAESSLNLDEAVRECRKAVELDGGNPAYLDSLGWALYKQGRLDQARTYLKKAARLAPDNPEIAAHLRVVLRELGS
jgi:Flp pilus assembly protein TadD